MFNKVIFYCHFGAGDIFESREFIKEIMTSVQAGEYYYAHGKNPMILVDIEGLKYCKIDERMEVTTESKIIDNDLFINCWIGRNSKYVLPNIGCVIDKNYEMYNDILSRRDLPLLSKTFKEYLPDPDFTKFYLENVNKFIEDTLGKRRVLICNGDVQSLQAQNFDFSPIIYELASRHKDTIFIETRGLPPKTENVFSSEWVIKSPYGIDLNEISYLALFCDVIVGRKSGPFVFAHSKAVWSDGNKKSLSFTYGKQGSHFVLQDDLFPLKKFWSPATDYETVLSEIERVLS